MKVILLDDIKKLGNLGDVVNVKRGYARNYLFPKNLAIEALDKNLKVLEARKRRKAEQLAKERAELEELAKRIEAASCTVAVTAGEEDRLFGAVTTEDITAAFRQENINIDKKQVLIGENIKKLGVYQVEIKLHPEITVSTKVWVVRK